ncbi:hypothetical protein BGI29_03920 [Snodgrassella communis]|uniref:hypothetical protein n=1 Tax=Snodgrassella communis TaxID=2946699 RepID=UPI000C1E8422|nr:hypothetical protein [Snodgrassella communis]PIT09851.1 hypothetical protein BGI29_03920 [Snodgrassella communis]
MSLEEDFRKLFGKYRPGYERTPNRPRLLGGAGVSMMPYGGDKQESNKCLDIYGLLQFNDSTGSPSIDVARAIEGLFDINSGRQVRIFLDPGAEICKDSNVKKFSDYIWYKLQLKNNHEAVLTGPWYEHDNNFFGVLWYGALDLLNFPLTLPGYPGEVMEINPTRKNIGVFENTVYRILKTRPLNAKAFFTTVPIKADLLESNRDQYKKAVKQIFDFVCIYINKDSKYNRNTMLETYATYQQTNSFITEEKPSSSKLSSLIWNTEQYAGKKIPEGGEKIYTWKTPNKPFIYSSAHNITLDARFAYWGLPADDYRVYESRWKFADDLVCGASLIKDYALRSAGITRDEEITKGNAADVKFGDHFIQSFDYSEGVQQYQEQDVSFYYRNKYDEEGNETGEEMNELFITLSEKGTTRLWSVDIFPDSAIIDLRFDLRAGKFIPVHPISQDLLPNKLQESGSLELQDINGNQYHIAQSNEGFVLTSDRLGKEWIISREDYVLKDKPIS